MLYELGAKVIAIGCKPDGMNINESCGVTDVCHLQFCVLLEKADAGLVLDCDSDQILYIIAREGLCNKQLLGGTFFVYGHLDKKYGPRASIKATGCHLCQSQSWLLLHNRKNVR